MTSSLSEHVPARDPEDDVDPELRAERGVLAHARRCLEAMRRRAESLRVAGGDWTSEEALQWSLQQRVASLADDGRTALFFGRVDYDDRVGEGEGAVEDPGLAGARFYLGRRHVIDDQGDPVVIDWRAALAHPFYRASPRRRYGVRRRRRYGWREGVLTGFQDERLDHPEDEEIGARALREEIERPRVGPMRDIVATIQPEQDDLIRAPLSHTICIQGGPGTGKTAVALHRVAFLLYEHRERLERDGVLVIGPSSAYLAFIRDVLPGLGEVRVAQVSLEQLVPGVEPGGADPPATATLKGDARMAEVVRRAVFRHLRWPAEPLRLRHGSRAVEVPPGVLRSEIATLLQRGCAGPPAATICAASWSNTATGSWRRPTASPPSTAPATWSTPWPGPGSCAASSTAAGRRWIPPRWSTGCSPTARSWPAPPTGSSTRASGRSSPGGSGRVAAGRGRSGRPRTPS